MEIAVKKLADDRRIDKTHSHPNWTMIREYPLSRQLLSMSRVWNSPDHQHHIIAAKGAPEAIADLCHLPKDKMAVLNEAIQTLAAKGLRLLGVASAKFKGSELPEIQHDFEFEFAGLLGYADPVREGISESIDACYSAGIQVIMITGDYPITASNIGKSIGLRNPEQVITGPELAKMSAAELKERIKTVSVFARVVPEQKMQIVDAIKANNQIVAMTGDGVNDAPALKSAHIGIAMGKRGTDVAREASALVLLDDNFSSIVTAIRLGRRIFDNLCKAMDYIIAVHIPLAGLALVPILLGFDEILYPTHIVFLELIIDPACSVVLEAELEDPDVMERPPRDLNKHMVGLSNLLAAFFQGVSILGTSLATYYFALTRFGRTTEQSNACAFAVLILGNIGLIMANRSKTLWYGQVLLRPNKPMLIVFFIVIISLFSVLYIPFMSKLFHFSDGETLPFITDICMIF